MPSLYDVVDPARLSTLSTVALLVGGAALTGWGLVRARRRLRAHLVGEPTAEGVVESEKGDVLRVTVRQRRDKRDGWVHWREVDRKDARRAFTLRLGDGARLVVEPTARTSIILPFTVERAAGVGHRERVARVTPGDRVTILGGAVIASDASGGPYRASARRVSETAAAPMAIVDPALVDGLRHDARHGARVLRRLAVVAGLAVTTALATAIPLGAQPERVVTPRVLDDRTLRLELASGRVFELDPADNRELTAHVVPVDAEVAVARYGPFVRPGGDVGMPVLVAGVLTMVLLTVLALGSAVGLSAGPTSAVRPFDERDV